MHISLMCICVDSDMIRAVHEYESLPATEECLSDTEAAADAWLEPTAIPTSADAKATRSLMPSPQYMHVLPSPWYKCQ